MRGVSLFSGAGIAEHFLKNVGIDIVVANELIPRRCELYNALYPHTKMICGDIMKESVFENILERSQNIDFLIASPPCQGMSIAGKNRSIKDMATDERNFLIERVFQFISKIKPAYILIENVPNLLKFELIDQGRKWLIIDLLKNKFAEEYDIDYNVLDAQYYEVPQCRKRAIIKMNLRGTQWDWPVKKAPITVQEAIGHLPSLESEQTSSISWHFARKHTKEHIKWMSSTPTGETAFNNKIHYPKKPNGERIRGYNSTYRRINWHEPAPTITIRNDAISSQRNVHPGKLKQDGSFSDARVLTPLELFILMSLPSDWNIPINTPEVLIRQCIGEAIPPMMIKNIVEGIKELN